MARVEEHQKLNRDASWVNRFDEAIGQWAKRYIPPVYWLGAMGANWLSRPTKKSNPVITLIFAVLIIALLVAQLIYGLN